MTNLYRVWKRQYDIDDPRAYACDIFSDSIVNAKRWYNRSKSINDLKATLLLKAYDQAYKDDVACMNRILDSL